MYSYPGYIETRKPQLVKKTPTDLENDRVDRSVCVQLEDVECHLIFIDKPRSEISVKKLDSYLKYRRKV